MTTRIVVALLASFSFCTSVVSDEAFNFFVEAARHSGYNPAEIATFQAELKVVTQRNYSDLEVEQARQRLENEPLLGSTYEERQRSREARKEIFNKMYSGEPRTRLVQAFLVNSAVRLGLEDALIQAKEIDIDRDSPFLFQIGSHVQTSADAEGNVKTIGTEARVGVHRHGDVTMINQANARNSMSYHTRGRAASVMTSWALGELLVRDDSGNFVITDASVAAFKKACEKYDVTFALSKERAKYEGDYFAFALEVYEKGFLTEQLWIDPERGYICPKEKRFRSTDGSVMYETVSENFVLDEHSLKWFPQKVTSSSWTEGQEKPWNYSEVHLVPGALILNQPIPDSVFTLSVPAGMRVVDFRRDDNSTTSFFAKHPGTLDLPTIEKKDFLDNADWIVKRPVRQHYDLPTGRAPFSWMQIVFMAAGIIMIILGLIIRFLKRQKSGS